MDRRVLQRVAVGVVVLGLAGLRPVPSFAATTVSGCPTTESALSADIATAGSGGTVAFTCTSATTIPFSNPITVNQPVTLDASGATGAVTFDGGGTKQLFLVNGAVSLTLKGLTLAHGFPNAIDNFGSVTITNSTLSANSSSFATNGGAISNERIGAVTITNSTLSGNSANGRSGGAIANAGTMTIARSTLSGNSAHFGGNSGAILNLPGGALTISNSTFSGNSADFTSGAITNATGGTTSITNSTLSGNSIGANGSGAIINFGGGTVQVGGSIIANNTGGNCANGGAFIDLGYNLSSDSSCGFSSLNHDLSSTNPVLGPLANNGGPTETMAPLSTSPAIDSIPLAHCPATDQRGVTRPDGSGETACDIGAVESSYVDSTTTTVTSSVNPSNFGQSVTFTATVAGPSAQSGTPSGMVRFFDGATLLGTCTLNQASPDQCSVTTSVLTVGSHTITAAYAGDANFTGSSASLTQVVGLPTAMTACSGIICPTARASFTLNGVMAGIFLTTSPFIGALLNQILYMDSSNSSAYLPGCTAYSGLCTLQLSSFTCSGTTANVYGTVHFGAAVRDIHLVLSGTSTSLGTFSIQEAWAGGSYSRTITGGGIVSVTCPV